MSIQSKFRNFKTGSSKESNESNLYLWIKEQLDQGLTQRRRYEAEWLLTLAFLEGLQNSFFNMSTHSLQNTQMQAQPTNKVDNQMIWRYQKQVSNFIASSPEMCVIPNTNMDEDIQAAKVGDLVLKSFFHSNRMRKKRRLLAGWIYATGNAFMDDVWNRKAGPTELSRDGTVVYAGDVECNVWSPFEIVFPADWSTTTDIHRLPWLAKLKRRAISYFQDTYSEKGHLVTPEEATGTYVSLDSVMGRPIGDPVIGGAAANEIQIYVQPCSKFPKGLSCICANGVILSVQDYPWSFYHLEHFKDFEVPGRLYGKATSAYAVPLQKSWNRVISSLDEFNDTCAKGKMLSPRKSNISVRDDMHGQTVYYDPVLGHKPEMLTLKGLPQTYQFRMELLAAAFENLYAQHEVSRGTNKSDLRSGEMVSLLLEQDASYGGPTRAISEENIEATMSRVLRRIQKGYTTERTLEITGLDREIQVIKFQGKDLRNNTAVSVRRDSAIVESRTVREVRIERRFAQGLYGDPVDPRVRRNVLRMLDDAIVTDIYGDDRLDESNAVRENEFMFRSGSTIEINAYDKHDTHLREHTRFQKGWEYQQLKFKQPKAFFAMEVVFLQHNLQHQKFIREQLASMAEQFKQRGGK